MGSSPRTIVPPLADLMDSLTIYQIKQVMDAQNSASYAVEMNAIEADLDGILASIDIRSIGEFLRLLVALSQINLHIWHVKDQIKADPTMFDENTKLGHQLNGIRNQLKNRLSAIESGEDPSGVRTNTGTDGLEGWQLSILTGDSDK